MAAFDSASSDLFCNEETKGLSFYDDDNGGGDDDPPQPSTDQIYQRKGEKDLIFSNGLSDSEPLVNLPCLSEECVHHMLEREGEHLPRKDYLARLRNGELDYGLRREALDWMLKACTHFSFGEMCLYSAISYFDRFLSTYVLPLSLEKGGKNWAVQLAAVSCLSLAAKIEEVNVPPTLDLQVGGSNFMFEGKTIQRMEILVLNTLNWRIKAYTPCNFLDYYLRKMNEGEFQLWPLVNRSVRIILTTIEGIEFLEFRPSEIAASVAVLVSREMQGVDFDKALSCLIGVEKGRVLNCLKLVQDLLLVKGTITTTTTTTTTTTATVANSTRVANALAPYSPNGVLDAACLSYKSDEATTLGQSSSHISQVSKRRKLDKTSLGGDS